jgi:ABC-2 type transport system ATP-binding protein
MSGLDPIGRREVRDLIASLRQTGTTVFMCSHILSDIEVLCDRVAILKKGKLAHIGRLNELRGQERKANLEIIVTGTDVESLSKQLSVENDFVITETADGVRIEVPEETDVDPVIAALRRANGKLVSVQAVKQSLEELFVD